MKLIVKQVGDTLNITEIDEEGFKKLKKRGFIRLPFSGRYYLYSSYKASDDVEFYNCNLRVPRQTVTMNCHGTIYFQRKFLWFKLDCNEKDLKILSKYIVEKDKDVRF